MRKNSPARRAYADPNIAGDMTSEIRAQQPVYSRMRRYARYRCDSPVSIRGMHATTPIGMRGHCVNIGVGGVGCIASAKLKPGDFVVLQLELPRLEQPLTVGARVRHAERFFHGLEFVAPSMAVEQAIRHVFTPEAPAGK